MFSVQQSGHFQGYAFLNGDRPDPRVVTTDLCFGVCGAYFGSLLPVKWIKRANIPFQATCHLLNPYNENRPVQTSCDGQVIVT